MEYIQKDHVKIIRLKGSRNERARQHGELIASLNDQEKDALVYSPLSKKNQLLLKRAIQAASPFRNDILANTIGTVTGLVYEAFALILFLFLPKTVKSRLTPFAFASKLPLKKIWLSLYQPDLLMALAASAHPSVQKRLLPGLPGCSTAMIHSDKHTRLIRNLDYPAAGFWEKHTAIFYHEPSEPELQRYISVSTLGIHTSGLTGCNASGICVSLHAHFSKKVQLFGTPIFFLVEELLEEARTLDHAIAIAKKFKPIGSWALNIQSAHESRSITLELSNRSVQIIESGQYGKGHSNVFESAVFKPDELHFSGAFFEDCHSRSCQLHELTEKLSGHFDWNKAFTLLSSHESLPGEAPRIFGNTLSVVTTIQSVGFDIKDKALYVSSRRETPTPHGPYLKLPLHFPNEAEITRVELDRVHSPAFMRALHFYHAAYVANQVKGKAEHEAYQLLTQAVDTYGQDPHLRTQRAHFALKHGDYLTALADYDYALTTPLTPHLKQVVSYFKAVSLDCLNKRHEALKVYQELTLANHIDPLLKKRALKRLTHKASPRTCQSIVPDLQFVEPIDYA